MLVSVGTEVFRNSLELGWQGKVWLIFTSFWIKGQPGGKSLSLAALSLETEALLYPSVLGMALSGCALRVWDWALRMSVLSCLWGGSWCPSSLLGGQSGSIRSCRSCPSCRFILQIPLPLLFPQVARTLMVTHIPKEITDPSLIIKHFQ